MIKLIRFKKTVVLSTVKTTLEIPKGTFAEMSSKGNWLRIVNGATRTKGIALDKGYAKSIEKLSEPVMSFNLGSPKRTFQAA